MDADVRRRREAQRSRGRVGTGKAETSEESCAVPQTVVKPLLEATGGGHRQSRLGNPQTKRDEGKQLVGCGCTE